MYKSVLPSVSDRFEAFAPDAALTRRVLDMAPVSMGIMDVGGTLTYANLSFAAMLGRDTEGCCGLTAAEFIHPEDSVIFGLHLARVRTGETDRHFAECRIISRDGSAIWVGASVRLLREEMPGATRLLILQFTDIGRQKHAEGAMSTGEGRLSYALDAARQGVWDLDLVSGTAYYSGMWREMRGIGPTDFVDCSIEGWLSRVHPDDRQRLHELATKQNLGEIDYNIMEYRERHRDGHYIWILSRGRPIEWMLDGTVARMLGTDTDISSLKAVEARLAEEKERLRITLHAIGDGVISTDTNNRITFMNPVAERMTGWRLDATMGHSLSEIFVIATNENTDLRRSSIPPDPTAGIPDGGKDALLFGRDGERREIHYTSSPVRATDGETVGVVLVFQDVTQNRELQRRLAHSANHDALTGLPNRSAFDHGLALAVETARSMERHHVLCLLDLDRFKAVNDAAGHAAGDALLKQVAETTGRIVHAPDFAGRIGGDEFAVILHDCDLEQAEPIAQKLSTALCGIDFRWNGHSFSIGASIGLTVIDRNSLRPVDLKEEADIASYEAKRAGGGCVRVHRRR